MGTDRGFVVQGKRFDVLSQGINSAAFERLCERMKKHCGRLLHELNQEIVSLETAA